MKPLLILVFCVTVATAFNINPFGKAGAKKAAYDVHLSQPASWIVKVKEGQDPNSVAKKLGLQNKGKVGTVSNLFKFEEVSGGHTSDLKMAKDLEVRAASLKHMDTRIQESEHVEFAERNQMVNAVKK